jgi:hypothetical protein
MKVLSFLKTFFSKFFKETVEAQLAIIVPIALEAVKKVAADPTILTSDAKRAIAISMILAELTAKELLFAKRLVNLALEIAVVEFKGVE